MTINQTKLKQLEQRTVRFSAAVVKTCAKYNTDPALHPIIDQLVHSATAIGAHCAAANSASSKTDFANDIFIAKKAAGETRYWLKVLAELLPKENLSRLSQEVLKLALVLQKIVATLEETNNQLSGNYKNGT